MAKTEKKEFQISLQKLKRQIKALRKAVNSLRATGLNDTVLYNALKTCANRYYKPKYHKPISTTIIKAVVEGIGDLEDYIFPPDKD